MHKIWDFHTRTSIVVQQSSELECVESLSTGDFTKCRSPYHWFRNDVNASSFQNTSASLNCARQYSSLALLCDIALAIPQRMHQRRGLMLNYRACSLKQKQRPCHDQVIFAWKSYTGALGENRTREFDFSECYAQLCQLTPGTMHQIKLICSKQLQP